MEKSELKSFGYKQPKMTQKSKRSKIVVRGLWMLTLLFLSAKANPIRDISMNVLSLGREFPPCSDHTVADSIANAIRDHSGYSGLSDISINVVFVQAGSDSLIPSCAQTSYLKFGSPYLTFTAPYFFQVSPEVESNTASASGLAGSFATFHASENQIGSLTGILLPLQQEWS